MGRTVVVLFFPLITVLSFASSPVDKQDIVCETDVDCSVQVVGCHCMYCARSDDVKAGIVVAVNKKSSEKYKSLSDCSKQELKKCSMAGPCAITGESVVRCVKKECVISYQERNL